MTTNYETRKNKIVTELYSTGRLNGKYFDRSPRGDANPLRGYIREQFKRRSIELVDDTILDDCYNELFLAVCKMDAQKFCEIHAESPNKLMATILNLVQFKCFANDNKPVPNPNHSLVGRLMYTSALDSNNTSLSYGTKPSENADKARAIVESKIGADYIEPESGFGRKYGCEVEDIIDQLNPQQQADFYEMAAKPQRANESVSRRARRNELYTTIKALQAA